MASHLGLSLEAYLKVYRCHIGKAVDVKDLLFHYVHFTPEQRKKIIATNKNNPSDATAEALDFIIKSTEDPGRFQALLEALESGDYEKEVKMLKGQEFASDEHEKLLINLFTPSISKQFKPSEVLPYLLALGVLNDRDIEEIEAETRNNGDINGVYRLLQLIDRRQVCWFSNFFKSLIQANQEHVAVLIDQEFTEKIKAQLDHSRTTVHQTDDSSLTTTSMSSNGSSLQPSTSSKPSDSNTSLEELSLDDTGVKANTMRDSGGPFDEDCNNLNASNTSATNEDPKDEHDPMESLSQKLGNLLDDNDETEQNDFQMRERSEPEGTEMPSDIENTSVKVIYERNDPDPERCENGQQNSIIRENSSSPLEKTMRDKKLDFSGSAGEAVQKEQNLNISGEAGERQLDEEEDEKEEDVVDEDISLREYQVELAGPALNGKNVIIVAPTGSGKTRVAMKIMQEHMRRMRGRLIPKIIFIVQQVALANQQGEECRDKLRKYKTKIISGESQRAKSERLKDFIGKRDILVVTAQVLLDALVKKEVEDICQFSLMVFDECHHTNSNHAFNQIMHIYMDLKLKEGFDITNLPQIVGLTASVGVGKATDVDKAVQHIKKLMSNLDASQICTVQSHMDELRQFVSLPDEETCTVPRREKDIFGQAVNKTMETIEKLMNQSTYVTDILDQTPLFAGVLKAPAQRGSAQYTQWVSKLWKETAKLRSQDARRFLNPCRTHLEYYNNALIIYNDARVEDALSYLNEAMKRWQENAIMNTDEKILKKAYEMLKVLPLETCSQNPKLSKLKDMVIKAYTGEKKDSRGIVFVKTRSLAKAIIAWMKQCPGLKELNPTEFVGQTATSEGGMTKNEQHDVLKFFRDGKHKLIVATSVAEEGLDISKCNLVIRYDHVTNEIAMVQSRGRGRAQDSKYIVLAEQGTGNAEKEEMNMIREILMRKAIIQLQTYIDRQQGKFAGELRTLQDDAKMDRDIKALTRKGRRIRDGEFELRCLKCDSFICMSTDIKKIQNAHHVILDESLKERVKFIRFHSPRVIDETIQFDGKFICKDCGYELGTICIHRHLHFPVGKISNFLVVDMVGRQDTFKRWKDVCFTVEQVTNEDFRTLLEQMKAGRVLVETFD